MKKALLISALAVAVVFGVATYATADSVTHDGTTISPGIQQAQGSVNVAAVVNPKITLTITTPDAAQSVNFGAVDPGSVIGGKAVNLSVNSNKAFTLAKSVSGQNAAIGLSTSLAGSTGNAKGAAIPFVDNYSINVPYTTDPGNYTATVQYTVTQE